MLAAKRAERHDCARPRTTTNDRPRMHDRSRMTTHDRPRPRTTTHDRPRTHDHVRPRTTDHGCHICLRKQYPPHPRGVRGLNCLARLALARELVTTKSTAHSRRKTNVLSFDKRCFGYFLGLAKAIDVNLPSSNIA